MRSRSPITSSGRIRKPVDLLRCVVSGIEIIVLAVAGVAASATTAGIETDIVGASKRLPHTLLVVAPATLTLFAILIIPVALAVRELVRRQFQRLAEAVATGVLAGVVTAVANVALRRAVAARLYDAIIMSHPGASHAAALDPYLAGLVAYATIIGVSGRPGWRNSLWIAIGVYALVHLGVADYYRPVPAHHAAPRPRDRPRRPLRGGEQVDCVPARRRSPPR